MSKSLVRSLKNVANGYSSVQVMVRNATSNDPTGPTTYEMEEIALSTYLSQTDFLEIMDMLDRRLNDKGKNWRHVAKSLTVLDYLVRFGLEKCVLWLKDNLYIIKTLREFIHFDEMNNDQGAIIRVKAKELVLLLRNDERLTHERELAARSRGDRSPGRRNRRNTNSGAGRNDPYDADLQKALELSRLTAEQEQEEASRRNRQNDPDLEAALKLSLEEEEMRKLKQQQDTNLLDLDDNTANYQPQYYMQTGYYQPQQQYVVPQQYTMGQYDMFGNPIQNPMATGFQQQQYPQFTGFNYGQQQQQQQPQELTPLKTGSNNPFALQSEQPQERPQTLNNIAEQQQQQQTQQPTFFTQPAQQPQPQPQAQVPAQRTGGKFNDQTHSELNNLLALGTGVDTFGNTGDTRIPHQHTRTGTFVNSSGKGYRQVNNEQQRLTTGTTGNPFLTAAAQLQQPINPAYTGYGFGNAQPQQQKNGDGPSLIDI